LRETSSFQKLGSRFRGRAEEAFVFFVRFVRTRLAPLSAELR
jgi:hypothetical protein